MVDPSTLNSLRKLVLAYRLQCLPAVAERITGLVREHRVSSETIVPALCDQSMWDEIQKVAAYKAHLHAASTPGSSKKSTATDCAARVARGLQPVNALACALYQQDPVFIRMCDALELPVMLLARQLLARMRNASEELLQDTRDATTLTDFAKRVARNLMAMERIMGEAQKLGASPWIGDLNARMAAPLFLLLALVRELRILNSCATAWASGDEADEALKQIGLTAARLEQQARAACCAGTSMANAIQSLAASDGWKRLVKPGDACTRHLLMAKISLDDACARGEWGVEPRVSPLDLTPLET